MALLAHAVVAKVEAAYPSTLWKSVRQAAGVTWTEYDDYFRGAEQAVGIWLRDVVELEEPIPLAQLRERWPWFRPPQSYCFLQAQVEPSRRRVKRLAPRA
jgi:predicted transcriptional regulator